MDRADDHEKQYRANRGFNDCRNDARPELDPKLRKDPARDEGACDSNDEIADGAKACTPDDLAREPTSGDADNQYDEEIFA